MGLAKKVWISVIGLTLLGIWWGMPTFNKWRADKLVDALCGMDGGVKVYETVILPKEPFNQWGQFEVRGESYMKPDDEFFMSLNIPMSSVPASNLLTVIWMS